MIQGRWKKFAFIAAKLLAGLVLLLLGLFFSIQIAVILILWWAG
ncbi:hypothetical protein J2TS6_02580 [Paenibacillus albilobatus]|uniref:Uncharacterized protein n=1 Tax=Paenibacillus albilobatus TaxID=2716884 RepID=A0A919XAN0_9BACL|nr:hypothetical protein J2TS6_02580 [Paenibacillus albilobatus]